MCALPFFNADFPLSEHSFDKEILYSFGVYTPEN